VSGKDWVAWHRDYDADTPLARRLATVQRQIRAFVDSAPPGPIRVVSMCAGEGRDLIGALAGHPRRGDVRARLVELDPVNAASARRSAAAAGLTGVDVVEADAGTTDAYAGAVPAGLLLVCGVFGNVVDGDIEATIAALPSLSSSGARLIWTRSRREPDLTPDIRRWCIAMGFEEIAFEPIEGSIATVGTYGFVGAPVAFRPGLALFSFRPDRQAIGARSPAAAGEAG
jgi:hypothetical protein